MMEGLARLNWTFILEIGLGGLEDVCVMRPF